MLGPLRVAILQFLPRLAKDTTAASAACLGRPSPALRVERFLPRQLQSKYYILPCLLQVLDTRQGPWTAACLLLQGLPMTPRGLPALLHSPICAQPGS